MLYCIRAKYVQDYFCKKKIFNIFANIIGFVESLLILIKNSLYRDRLKEQRKIGTKLWALGRFDFKAKPPLICLTVQLQVDHQLFQFHFKNAFLPFDGRPSRSGPAAQDFLKPQIAFSKENKNLIIFA